MMPDDPNEPIKINVNTNKYQITYFPDRNEFLLVLSGPFQHGNVSIERFELRLEAEIVRDMAEVLPPRDPETVH